MHIELPASMENEATATLWTTLLSGQLSILACLPPRTSYQAAFPACRHTRLHLRPNGPFPRPFTAVSSHHHCQPNRRPPRWPLRRQAPSRWCEVSGNLSASSSLFWPVHKNVLSGPMRTSPHWFVPSGHVRPFASFEPLESSWSASPLLVAIPSSRVWL